MEASQQWLIPYIVSNIVFGLTIAGALKKPMWTRIFLAGFFLGASIFNGITSVKSPGFYFFYASGALPIYREFINGAFSHYITPFVFTIAIGQFLIFLGLILKHRWTQLACVGGILFGLAIAPMWVGSAFPAIVLMAIAFFVLLKRYKHDYILKWQQYKAQAQPNLLKDVVL
jgi:hypothetical protein